jgi:hypothetical protein
MALVILAGPEGEDNLKILQNGTLYEVMYWQAPNGQVKVGRMSASVCDFNKTLAYFEGLGWRRRPASETVKLVAGLRGLVEGMNGLVEGIEKSLR